MKKRLLSIVCIVALLLSMTAFPISAAAADWITQSPPSDVDYSFAVLGDIQTLTWYDRRDGTDYVESMFDWILNNRESRKIEYVIGLGDTIETLSTWPESGYNTSVANPGEWSLSSAQFARLDGVIPYLVIRGNHDDEAGYHSYICTEDYKNQMNGFFYDPSKPAVYGNSMSNSYQKITVGGEKYLMLALDYDLNDDIISWANAVIEANPDYKVIVSVHVYLASNGDFYQGRVGQPGVNDQNDGDPWHDFITFDGEALWNDLFSKHENVFMVLSGHVAITDPIVQTRTGDAGNKVTEILVDPQAYDEDDPSGMVMMLNFIEGGNEIKIEYLSSIKNKHFKASNQKTVKIVENIDFEEAFIDLGYNNAYVGAPVAVAPVLDGVIRDGEYSYSRVISTDEIYNYAGGEIQSAVTEYFAHDEDYVYYGNVFKQASDNRAFQFQFRPFNSFNVFHGSADLTNYYYQRITWQARYQSNGSTTVTQTPGWNNSVSLSAPIINEDLWVAASKDAQNVKTYEVKISKAYIAEVSGVSVDEVRVIPYMTYYHSSAAIGHRYTAADVSALSASAELMPSAGELGYLFMVLDDKPREITEWETLADELGLNVYVGETVSVAPVLDGVVSSGEYSASRKTALADLYLGDGGGEVQGDSVVEYFAHDASFIYYAVVFEQASDNRACWPQFKVDNTFDIYNTSANGDSYYHSRASLQARYLASGATINNGIAAQGSYAAPVYGEDIWVTAAKSADNVKTYEFKLAKAYFAEVNGVDTADVSVIPYFTYFHASCAIAHTITADDRAALGAAGADFIPELGGAQYYFIVLGDRPVEKSYWETVTDELGLNVYIGDATTVSPTLDGVIGAGEYSFTRTVAHTDLYNSSSEIQSGVTEYFAHDAEYIYYAASFVQANNNRAFQFQFKPFNSFDIYNDASDLHTYYHNRVVWQARYQDSGLSIHQAPGWNNAIPESAPVMDEDIWCAATKSSANVKVYEVKISKAYIAELCGCETGDVRVLPYMTFFHSSCAVADTVENGDAIKLDVAGAEFMPTVNTSQYYFIVLSDK